MPGAPRFRSCRRGVGDVRALWQRRWIDDFSCREGVPGWEQRVGLVSGAQGRATQQVGRGEAAVDCEREADVDRVVENGSGVGEHGRSISSSCSGESRVGRARPAAARTAVKGWKSRTPTRSTRVARRASASAVASRASAAATRRRACSSSRLPAAVRVMPFELRVNSGVPTVSSSTGSEVIPFEPGEQGAGQASQSTGARLDGEVALSAPEGIRPGSACEIPADISWRPVADTPARHRPVPPAGSVPADTVESVRKVLDTKEPVVILLGGRALRERGLRAVASIAEATGATLLAETFPARFERGGGLPPIQRLAYLGEMAIGQLASARHIILVDTPAPVSFFAYPGQPSELWPTGCELHFLAGSEHDVTGALEALAGSVRPSGPSEKAGISDRPPPLLVRPTGSLTSESLAAAIAYVLPEGAVVATSPTRPGSSFLGATGGTSPRLALQHRRYDRAGSPCGDGGCNWRTRSPCAVRSG